MSSNREDQSVTRTDQSREEVKSAGAPAATTTRRGDADVPTFRFSGHETFPCRYAWLPKGYQAVSENPRVFEDEDGAMTELGVGKNMMRAIRFWLQATGIVRSTNEGLVPTAFGNAVLGEKGFDPYLEDMRTLWLLHWKLCNPVESPLFAWDFMINRWSRADFTVESALAGLQVEADRMNNRRLSKVTLDQHFDVFLHSYVPTRTKKGDVQEDRLDCPLVELELIESVGERRSDQGTRTEPIYAFRREEKKEVTHALFLYCLDEYWGRAHAAEATLQFREVAFGERSPGQVFKLPEIDVRARLENIDRESSGRYAYRESASFRHIVRDESKKSSDLLRQIYRTDQ